MKNFRKIISLLLCFTVMLSCQPAFFIAAEDSATQVYLINEDFEDEEYDIFWETPNVGTAERSSEGYFELFHPASPDGETKTTTKTNIYFDKDKKTFSGEYTLEFDVYCRAKTLYFQVIGSDGDFLKCTLNPNGTLKIGNYTFSKTYTSNPVKLKFLFNTETGTIQVWINGELRTEDFGTSLGATDLKYMYMYFSGTDEMSATLDNIKFYNAATSSGGDTGGDNTGGDNTGSDDNTGGDDNTDDDTSSTSPLEEVRDGDYIIDEQFTGNVLTSTTASMWSNSFDGTNYILENDAYTLKGADAKKTSTLSLGGSYSGVYGFEVDLTHNAQKTLFFEVQGTDGNLITGRLSNKNLRISGKEADIYRDDVDEAKLKFLFYTQAGKFSAWVGDEQILDMADAATITSLTKFYIYFNSNTAAASATIDNIKFYKARPFNTDDAVVLDAACLDNTIDTQTPLLADLTLPQPAYGSDITWEITEDASDVAEINGNVVKIVRDALDTDATFTLTATISKDGEDDITKTYTFTVKAPDAMPVRVGNYLIDEQFTDNKYNTTWGHTFNETTHVLSDDAFVFKREAGDGKIEATLSLSAAQTTGLSGVYALETEIVNSEGKTLQFQILGEDGRILTSSLNPGSKTLTVAGHSTVLKEAAAKLTFLFYTKAGKFSVWLDGERIIYMADADTATPLDSLYMYLNADDAKASSATIDNIKLYKAEMFEEDFFEAEKACLREEFYVDESDSAAINGQISKDLKTLPDRGEYGSYITWESLDPDYISSEGKLQKDPEDTPREVKLRATIRKTEDEGSEFETKELTFTIAPYVADEYSESCPAPTAENGYIINDSMKGQKLPSELVISGGAPAPTNNGVKLDKGDSFIYMLGKNGKVYNELIALSLHIEGTGTTFDLYDDLDTKVFSFAMTEAGLAVWARSGNMSENENENAQLYVIKKVVTTADITIATDPITGLFSLWCEEELVANARLGADDCSKLEYLKVEHSGEGEAVISDLKLYYPTLAAFSALSLDRAALTLERLTWHQETDAGGKPMIVDDIKLPALGRAGSVISWTSSNPEVIAIDNEKGIVTQSESEDYSVTMSAEVTFDNSDEGLSPIEFDFTVPSGTEYEQPEIKELIYEESFAGNDTSTAWSQTPSVGEIFVKRERLYFKRQTAADVGVTKAYYYFDQSMQSKQGVYGFDCTVWNKAGNMKFKVEGVSDEIIFTNMSINPSGGSASYRDENGNVKSVGIDCSKRIGLRFLFNTQEETFSLWVNGKLVIPSQKTETENTSAGIKRIYMYLGNTTGTKQEAQIDDIRFYEAYPLNTDRVRLDMAWLAENQDRLANENDPMLRFGMISEDLTLPTRGEYGSYIEWTSDRSEITVDGTTGVLHTATQAQNVTLTAKFSNDGVAYNDNDKLEIPFTVAPSYIENDADAVETVASMLTPQSLAPFEDLSDGGVKRSLSLPTEGIYGCSITWVSDNTNYIDNVGRVTRPRYDGEDVTVTLTATISRGNVTETAEIPVQVLKDKGFTDPQHMTDAEFFGEWNGTAWTTEGKLDYDSYEGLSGVEAAVKANDYALAKEELLTYFRGERDVSAFERPSRNAGWANMVTDDFQHLQTTAYYRGSMWVGNEWNSYSTSLKTGDLTSGSTISFSVRAWYNEDSYAEFAKHTAAEGKKPVLELTIDGTTHKFAAIDSVTVRAGNYKEVNYSGDEYLKAANYGDFTGDGLWETYLKFNVSSVTGENVSSARLVLYGHSSTGQDKRLIVLYHNDNTWSSDTLKWGDITQLIYSYNGLGDRGESDSGLPDSVQFPMERWTTFIEANNSYGQISRFNSFPVIAYEYLMTQDEKYAYKAMKIMQDFISTTGGFKSNGTSNKSRGVFKASWDHADVDGELKRGAYDTTLTSAIRAINWLNAMKAFMSSKYMTADFLTAALKSIWDTADYLTVYNSGKGNWMNSEMQGLQAVADNVPEFTGSGDWVTYANQFLAVQLFNNTFSDGSYIESTDAYGHGSLKTYITIKSDLEQKGYDVNEICKAYYADPEIGGVNTFGDVIGDETFDERLKKLALYQILMYAPNGRKIQYGDSGYGDRTAGTWDDVYKWFSQENPPIYSDELKYLATYGKYGTKPSWTSKTFTDSGITTLRGGWSENSPYLFTNVRGGGAHGHRDYNSITMIGYGNTLIADSGYFEYDTTDDYRQYGVSTEAHSTVMINNTNQTSNYNSKITDMNSATNARPSTGTIHSFVTNGDFDYLQQSTPNNYNFGNHMRTITYLKSDLFIVSDRMVPDASSGTNNYKQLWHMYPEAYPGETDAEKEAFVAGQVDGTSRKIYSSHKSGGNVIIASADTETKWAPAWCAKLYAKVEYAPYFYYEVNAAGTTCLNTVIMAKGQGKDDDVSVETLYKDENTSALKLNMVQDSANYTGYYLLSYDGSGGSFGPYETDAEMAYVQLNEDGSLYNVMLKGGTYIKVTGGDYIFKADSLQAAVSIDFSGSEMRVELEKKELEVELEEIRDRDVNAVSLEGTEILAYEQMTGLYINDEAYSYSLTGGYVTDIGEGNIATGEEEDNVKIEGVVGNTPPVKGETSTDGGSGGGGGGGGGGSDKPDTDTEKTDPDVSDDEAKPDGEITEDNKENIKAFSDMKNHWAENYIEDLQKKGIVNGDDSGKFNPDNQITRAEFIAMVTRSMNLAKVPYKDVYSDVKDSDWYSECILQALSAGIISKDVFFRPNAPITREEMAKIISEANNLNAYYSASEEHLKDYIDSNVISKWAKEYVSLITQSGLMKGRDNGFCPRDNSTRAEAATVISRMLSK